MTVVNVINAPFFHGEFDLTQDIKHRIQIPATVRRALDEELHGKTLFMTVGQNDVAWLYAQKHYIAMVNQRPTDMMPSQAMTDYARLKFGMCVEVEWDTQGRTVLSEKAVQRWKLGKELTLLGVGDHLELWNRAEWETYGARLRQSPAEVEQRAKDARLAETRLAETRTPLV